MKVPEIDLPTRIAQAKARGDHLIVLTVQEAAELVACKPLVEAAMRYGDAVANDGVICQDLAEEKLKQWARVVYEASKGGKQE
jgi:hypothetical protein